MFNKYKDEKCSYMDVRLAFYELAYFKIHKPKLSKRYEKKTYLDLLKNERLPISKYVVQQVYEDNIKRWGALTCYLCGEPIIFGDDNIEHKIPVSRGGTNSYDNLDIAHKACNLKKRTQTVEEYKSNESNTKKTENTSNIR